MTTSAELSLFELVAHMWSRKFTLLGVAFCLGVLGGAFSFLLEPTFRSTVLAAPVDRAESRNLPIGGALGGLASLANFGGTSGDRTEEYIAVLKSRKFLRGFVEEKSLLPVLFSDQWNAATSAWISPDERPEFDDAYRLLTEQGVLSVSRNQDSGLVSVSIEWPDPSLAADWANELVSRLNEYLRQEAIRISAENLGYLNQELEKTQVAELRLTLFQLMGEEQKSAMLANSQRDYAFRIIDPAVEAKRRSSPRRALIAVLSAIVGFTLAALYLLVQIARTRHSG